MLPVKKPGFESSRSRPAAAVGSLYVERECGSILRKVKSLF